MKDKQRLLNNLIIINTLFLIIFLCDTIFTLKYGFSVFNEIKYVMQSFQTWEDLYSHIDANDYVREWDAPWKVDFDKKQITQILVKNNGIN